MQNCENDHVKLDGSVKTTNKHMIRVVNQSLTKKKKKRVVNQKKNCVKS